MSTKNKIPNEENPTLLQVKCPHCGAMVDVHDRLEHEVRDKIQESVKRDFAQKEKELAAKLKEIDAQKKKVEEEFDERLQEGLRRELKVKEAKIKAKLDEENAEQMKLVQEELREKSEKLKELNRTKIENEKLQREKEEIKDAMQAEFERLRTEELQKERERIHKAESERLELVKREYEKKLEDQKKLTEEQLRKHEQGSMQLQGETQELAIEEWLAAHFATDNVEEIKKGARGGDCIQIVNTPDRQNCGKIYYESKRTKDFQPAWIEKFKADMRAKEADVGVLVTEVMPKGADRMHFYDGVWVCTYQDFKALAPILRQSIIQINNALVSQQNKGEKMDMLYGYLISPAFQQQIEAIIEGFSGMKNQLDKEKRAMQSIWKEREKQIDKILTGTTDMYGSLKGIIGSTMPAVKALELDDAVLLEEPKA